MHQNSILTCPGIPRIPRTPLQTPRASPDPPTEFLTCQSRPLWYMQTSLSWKNFYRHLPLGPAYSSDIAGDGPPIGKRLTRNRNTDPLLRVQPTAQASPVNDPPASPTRPVSPEIATPVNPENENPQEAPAPTMRTLATNPRSSSEDVPRPPNDTRLIDMDPDQYVYFQEANETLRFIPERVLKPVRGVYVQLMRSIVNNPQDLLRWKKFLLCSQSGERRSTIL